ncbi:NAD-dependent histone deacetylase, silent information regulator Sir2 [Cordyceps fumosorosea ARSEF 2679]|uniref:NAD-dependent histone deacetylase, silent information regulator Sir2 n=1 Tax=Cordyceps fumosorosea (strain ARSEF 2679) TaxID=1081104 RepID=A0A167LRN0_CORFA|nr:NAD-dependent histone deacetylase, silent information regulator Sir2 [Cordyceps fumosorosea ARSEF 2679]OAA53413.1 NAD-dependent histone deacetylase, silent information regulator Sir2 [Cordyceps fumosorosea ARSEF 2679]
MPKPLLRIPYTEILAAPTVAPPSATSVPGAVAALRRFFAAPLPDPSRAPKTLVLTGAGLSVASGLPDYRGVNGTYRVNKTYRPIFHHEFLASHEARKRYWARSFLGWSATHGAAPNAAHYAVRDMGRLGLLSAVVTQNVDSFHTRAHPEMPTIELHGYLRTVVCTGCRSELDRNEFQRELARLNPRWDAFLQEALRTGALGSEDPAQRARRGIKTNPDGDVDLPDAPYTTFRYPPCPRCLTEPPLNSDSHRSVVETDADGAWAAPSTGGILKPNVVMFGESIAAAVRDAAEEAVNSADRLLVMGTSLATYSAWRLARQAKARRMPIAVVNAGGVRGEDHFFADLDPHQRGELGVRTEVMTEELLPALMEELRKDAAQHHHHEAAPDVQRQNSDVFKDMLS